MATPKNFFRRKNVNEAMKKVPQKNAGKKKGGERRYSLLAEDIFESSRLQGVMVVGNLHGKLREGDTMYVYQPKKPVMEVHVLKIELGPREEVAMAKDQQVGVCLDIENVEEISKFAVLSNIKPVEEGAEKRAVENPYLVGLTMEYSRLYTNSAYMDMLLYELCYARFLLPIYMDRPPVPQPDGTLGFGPDAQIGFRSLKKWDDETQSIFPVFSDEVALGAWKGAFQEGQPRQLASMFLPNLIEYVEKGGHAGMVLNPFGPIPVFFKKELLQTVKESEIFKARYVKKEENEN